MPPKGPLVAATRTGLGELLRLADMPASGRDAPPERREPREQREPREPRVLREAHPTSSSSALDRTFPDPNARD